LLPVDLDHRQPLAVPRLEVGIARDVDLVELEAELLLKRTQARERLLAQMAPRRVVEDDARYG
jgi:hypothetical protein